MDAALDFAEPGPAAGALVFTIGRFAGARPATDRAIALIVQRVVGNVMVADVVPNGFARPVGHRIEFHDVPADRFVDDIDFDDAAGGASGGLLAAQAGDAA